MTTATEVTREAWLNMALSRIDKLMADKAGAILPEDCRVSMGFPGGGSARKRIGECWPRSRSRDGVNEIFINPTLQDPALMLAVLVHEAVHAVLDCEGGHKGRFVKIAKAIGLVGKMTATVAGPKLQVWIDDTMASLPKLSHGALSLEGGKKQSTRMLKLTCGDCGYVVRTTQKWVDTGLPRCHCDGYFTLPGMDTAEDAGE